MRIAAPLRLRNEIGERLISHRSVNSCDLEVWGEEEFARKNFAISSSCKKLFDHLGNLIFLVCSLPPVPGCLVSASSQTSCVKAFCLTVVDKSDVWDLECTHVLVSNHLKFFQNTTHQAI